MSGQPVFGRRSITQGAHSIARTRARWSSIQRHWEDGVKGFSGCGAELKYRVARNISRILVRLCVVCTRRTALSNNLLGKEIVYALAGFWFVGSKDMGEGTVFTDDDDNVLDGRTCAIVVRPDASHQGSKETELNHRKECETQACSVQNSSGCFLEGHTFVPPILNGFCFSQHEALRIAESGLPRLLARSLRMNLMKHPNSPLRKEPQRTRAC